jgi:hypothetical protein
MGDHFWPSVYPAVAVGVLDGLALGGARNVLRGALGALALSMAALSFATPVFASEGLTATLALVAVALFGAFILCRLGGALLDRGEATSSRTD